MWTCQVRCVQAYIDVFFRWLPLITPRPKVLANDAYLWLKRYHSSKHTCHVLCAHALDYVALRFLMSLSRFYKSTLDA